jgi:hypothetical protein
VEHPLLDTFSTDFAQFQKWGFFQQNQMFNYVPDTRRLSAADLAVSGISAERGCLHFFGAFPPNRVWIFDGNLF